MSQFTFFALEYKNTPGDYFWIKYFINLLSPFASRFLANRELNRRLMIDSATSFAICKTEAFFLIILQSYPFFQFLLIPQRFYFFGFKDLEPLKSFLNLFYVKTTMSPHYAVILLNLLQKKPTGKFESVRNVELIVS